MQDLDGEVLATFIRDWRNEVIDRLRRDPLGYIGRLCPSIADSLPASFPDVEMARRLVRPTVSTPQALHSLVWSLRIPDAERILQLCVRYFRSPTGNIMFSLVRENIEIGIALRTLLAEATVMEGRDNGYGPVCYIAPP